jgi:hypothetical protein
MIYDLDQDLNTDYLAGFSDGSHGYPLRLKLMHNTAYIKGYCKGISQWAAELERREIENYGQSAGF